MKDWHLFVDGDDESDSECSRCGVIVGNDTLPGFTIPCPVPLCVGELNRGEPCVFVRSDRGVACAYCAGHGGD